jgi:hypothetical protein
VVEAAEVAAEVGHAPCNTNPNLLSFLQRPLIDLVAGVDSNNEVDYIEELIDKQEPIVKVLRVLCLMSLVQGGLKAKVLEHFKREIIQASSSIVFNQ